VALSAAKTAVETLRGDYETSLGLLKDYRARGVEALAPPNQAPVDLSDAEKYLERGNFAHPLLDAQRALRENPEDQRAAEVLAKATEARDRAIDEALRREKEESPETIKKIRYNELIEEAQRLGRDEKDFAAALKKLQEAVGLYPERIEARWGLATALQYVERNEESAVEYRRLVEVNPEAHAFRYELGLVLLKTGDVEGGLTEIGAAMAKTDQYDHFLPRLGDLKAGLGRIEEGLKAYVIYLAANPADYQAWAAYGDWLKKVGRENDAGAAMRKARAIKPTVNLKAVS
jgi:tetratricopeptide (TPR) repeat protein